MVIPKTEPQHVEIVLVSGNTKCKPARHLAALSLTISRTFGSMQYVGVDDSNRTTASVVIRISHTIRTRMNLYGPEEIVPIDMVIFVGMKYATKTAKDI